MLYSEHDKPMIKAIESQKYRGVPYFLMVDRQYQSNMGQEKQKRAKWSFENRQIALAQEKAKQNFEKWGDRAGEGKRKWGAFDAGDGSSGRDW